MRIFLLRHGESLDDIEDAYGGIADYPLTEAGRQTAQLLATKLTSNGIKVIYTSPYRRALETAQILAECWEAELSIKEGLRERNSYGVLSGVTLRSSAVDQREAVSVEPDGLNESRSARTTRLVGSSCS